jgi:hypothetical protein
MTEGLSKLLSQFEGLKDIDFSDSLVGAGYILQKKSMENAPVRTGFLRNSHETVKTEKGAEVRVNAEYAWYVEIKKPYMRPAIDEVSDEMIAYVHNSLDKQLKKIGG